MKGDLGSGLADRWNDLRDDPSAAPADFAPVLRILADAGLVKGDEEALTTLQVGPFRVAATPYETATKDFVDVLLPSLIVGLGDGMPVHGAVAGTLAGATRCFINALRCGVVFGRSPVDRLRWAVLMHIKQRRPTVAETAAAFGEEPVTEAVAWLEAASLIRRSPDGTLESLA
ncbi:hypothetical protein ACBR40_31020 [Nonomuraea sp. AD125B]|uniref:hypothetical protein n=1 Tax=Nonomuraea sp. AD125B TaxID=3242897 RepID=UPI0035295F0C